MWKGVSDILELCDDFFFQRLKVVRRANPPLNSDLSVMEETVEVIVTIPMERSSDLAD